MTNLHAYKVTDMCNPAFCFIAFLGFVANTNLQLAKVIGKRIRALRLAKGISLKHFEVLEQSMTRHSLSDIENGKKLPSLYTAFKIARALKVSVSTLFDGIKLD